MDEKTPLLNSVCQQHCPPRWCCASHDFPPPPLSEAEIRVIGNYLRSDSFYEKKGGYFHLKVKPNGYCIFFDEDTKLCAVYSVRPVDCRIFPFDIFFSSTVKAGLWLLWDCPVSRRLPREKIESTILRFEKQYAKTFIDTWFYEKDSVDPSLPDGFRVIREAKLVFTEKTPAVLKPLSPKKLVCRQFTCFNR